MARATEAGSTRSRLILAIGAATAIVASCTGQATPGPTFGTVSSPPPTSPASPAVSASPTGASPAPSSTATAERPFDPSTVSLTLASVARVPGSPLAITAPHDGSGRLFVAAQDGRAWVVDHGTTLSSPLLDIRDLVTTGGERGLLGIAVHPGFPADPRVYVDYIDREGNTAVAAYRLQAGDPNHLDPGSAHIVFTAGQPYSNHNGGALAFGPDGDLYVSLGDGGSEGDPQGNGQKLDTTLAKILRIDVDHPGNGRRYGIPSGNPFAGNPLQRPEIWLYGLRNPWRMSFDRATGNLWIGDVGQNSWEEIDVDPAGVGGLNYGWSRMEGDHCYRPASGCDRSGITLPVAEYDHQHGCAVIGGAVFRGAAQPLLEGAYVYSDNCSGTLWALDAGSARPGGTAGVKVGSTDPGIAGFGEDESGEIYAANLDGTISHLVAAPR